MANRRGKSGSGDGFYFSGFWKVTSDSHKIKKCFLLGRKAMTNPDSVLKIRGMILPTKICIVKAMVFPIVMYGCDSWTTKETERQRIDVFQRFMLLEKTP